MEYEQKKSQDNIGFWDEKKEKKYMEGIQKLVHGLYDLNEQYYKNSGNHFIRFIEYRLKTQESMEAKLKRKHKTERTEPIEDLLNDIAGVRLICFDRKQIYQIVKQLKQLDEFEIVKEKDYVKNPKDNGYQSYHMVLKIDDIKVELQIRTILMDAWSSLESILIYKKTTPIPEKLKKDILDFSKKSKKLDKMLERIMEFCI